MNGENPKLTVLRAEIRDLRAEADTARMELSSLLDQVASIKAGAASLQAVFDERTAEIERLRDLLDLREAEGTELRHAAEQRESRAALRSTEARIAALVVKAAQLGAAVALCAEELDEQQAAHEAAERDRERLRSAIKGRDDRIRQLLTELGTMRGALGTARLKSPLTTEPEAAQDLWARVSGIALRVSGEPEVSVIIRMRGQVENVVRCLASIAQCAPSTSIEVIVSDEASSNPLVSVLTQVEGLRLLRNENKFEFAKNCNGAAALARGCYLLFLDADTEATAGWLDALLDVVRAHNDAAIVGSKRLYADGGLQEAGGIVWRDGSTSKYGWLDDPSLPQYNYVRETDYVSGGSMLIDAPFFRSVGGFDDYYLPASCEDADLAFKARAAGRKVYYQPASVIVHQEGIGHDTDLSRGIKTYQAANQEKFCDRWKGVLEREHFPTLEHVFTARERSRERPCMLVIDHYVPQPDKDAGSRSMVHFMQLYLQMGINVKFWPQNLRYDPEFVPRMQQLGIETFHGSGYEGRFNQWMLENGRYVDYVFLSRPYVAAEYIEAIRAHCDAKILYYGHDIHYLRIREQMKVEPGDGSLSEKEAYFAELEERVWRLVDVIYYPSQDETEHVRKWLDDHGVNRVARTIPALGFESFPAAPAANLNERHGIIFVAGFKHPPNLDAAKWLVSEILPLIHARRPEVRLWLIGSNPPPEIIALESAHVRVTGFVSDEKLARFYSQARLAVAPLRYGAGVKGKVVEAMCYGVPIVTTTTGAQGLRYASDALVICDGPESFSQSVITLVEDDAAWRSMSARALTVAHDRFSAAAMREVLMKDVFTSKPAVV